MADFRLALLLLVRSRLGITIALLTLLVVSGAWLASQFSPRQPATVALDVGLSFIRILIPFLALLQSQELVAREVERRLIMSSLTYPRSRSSFILARYAAITAVATVITLIIAIALAFVVNAVGKGYAQATPVALGLPYLVTILFILLDVAVVVAFAVALASVATTPNLVIFGGMGFMIAARSASTIVQLLERERDLVKGGDWYYQGLQGVQWFLPDLAALDVRAIALYGKMEFLPQGAWALIVMAVGYVSLLLVLACQRFERRQFV